MNNIFICVNMKIAHTYQVMTLNLNILWVVARWDMIDKLVEHFYCLRKVVNFHQWFSYHHKNRYLPCDIRGCYLADMVYCNWLVVCFLLLLPLFFALSFPPINIEISLSLSILCRLFLKIDESDKFAKWLNCDSRFLWLRTLPIPEIKCLLFVWLSTNFKMENTFIWRVDKSMAYEVNTSCISAFVLCVFVLEWRWLCILILTRSWKIWVILLSCRTFRFEVFDRVINSLFLT